MSIDRRIAAGDFCLFLPLAVPGLGTWLIEALLQLNDSLSLPGRAGMDGLSSLLLSLMGLLGLGFAWLRLAAPAGMFRTQALVVKAAAALLILVAVLRGAPAVFLLIAAADGVAAILLAAVRGSR